MKAEGFVTDEIAWKAYEAFYKANKNWNKEDTCEAMRAALEAVAPLFAERYAAKIDALADAYDQDIASGIGKIDPELERKRKEQGYGLRDAAAEIRATKGNPHG